MIRLSLLLLSLTLSILCAPFAHAAGDFPTFISSPQLFSENEVHALRTDADIAQRTEVPSQFVVLQADGTSVGSAQQLAEEYRITHGVESAEGADDGIVFLIMWVPNAPERSVVVYSAGANAYSIAGLRPETIDAYITSHVLPELYAGNLFTASTFLIRHTRHTGLYVPPSPRTIEGPALAVKKALVVLAPLAAIATAALLSTQRQPTGAQRWKLIGIVLASAAILAALSVWTHSRIGIIAIGVMLIALAVWALAVTHTPSRRNYTRLLPDLAIILVLFFTSVTINMRQVEITPGDRDETRWLNRAYYAVDLVDPFGPTWQDYITTIGQPPLGSIAMGVGLLVQGEDVRGTGVWDYRYDRDWYIATGGYPTDDALHAGRRTNAVIGAVATSAAYVLGRLLTNRAGGIAAGIYLAWHPLHIVLSTQALSDETFVLMLLLSLIAAWRFADSPTWPRAIALGVCLGLGGATKLTPLLLAPPLVLFGALRLWLDRSLDGKRAGAMLIAQPFIAFATFVAVYPWLWENPLTRTWKLFAFRSQEMDAQTSAWPNALTDSPLHALARFGYKLTYTHSTSQKAMQNVYDALGIDRTAVGIDLLLAAAGAIILLWSIARHGLWTPRALVSILLAGELALLAIGMKADFYRYHLPVVIIVSACIAVAIGTLWSIASAYIRPRLPEEVLS